MSEHRFRAFRPLSLALLPCGAVAREELNDLVSVLTEKGMNVTVTAEKEIPSVAYNPARQQYRADLFLDVARRTTSDRVLVVTNCDLYQDNLNFVFGLADAPGRCAVISLFRLRIGVDEEGFRRRAVKEAIHELGHTLGLTHCANLRCVMYFSNSLRDTDRKETDCCERCERKLERSREAFLSLQRQVG